MSFKNLGNKQTIVLHNCEIENKKYDLVITPHTQTVGYIRTKRQTLKRKIITKQRQITRKRFSKNRNAFSESEASNLDELNLEASNLDEKQYKHKPVHLYNWNQPIRHIDNYLLTVIKQKNEPNTHSK